MNTITHDIFVHLIPSKELTNLFRKQVKGQRAEDADTGEHRMRHLV